MRVSTPLGWAVLSISVLRNSRTIRHAVCHRRRLCPLEAAAKSAKQAASPLADAAVGLIIDVVLSGTIRPN